MNSTNLPNPSIEMRSSLLCAPLSVSSAGAEIPYDCTPLARKNDMSVAPVSMAGRVAAPGNIAA
jgi:hypothetical protein